MNKLRLIAESARKITFQALSKANSIDSSLASQLPSEDEFYNRLVTMATNNSQNNMQLVLAESFLRELNLDEDQFSEVIINLEELI